jgi:fructokinase
MPASQPGEPATDATDVLVIGEAITDIVTTPAGTAEHPGGSPANVAYGLGLLGVSTSLLTAIGDDGRGRAIEEHLRQAGVALLPGSRLLPRTGSANSSLKADGSAEYSFDLSWELQTEALPIPKLLHTGSIASFLAPGAEVVKALLAKASTGCTVTYDPNIRPELLGSHAQARSTFEELVPFTDVVKLSDEDADWLYPQRHFEDAARQILKLGSELVIVTGGQRGSVLLTRDARLHVPAVDTLVADTIGAGDSYMSALIYGLLALTSEGYAPAVLESLGHTASRAAAITVGSHGANPPTLCELVEPAVQMS